MEEGDIIELKTTIEASSHNNDYIKKRKYKILKIYTKNLCEKDLFLLQEQNTGYKECFQRFDILEKFGLIVQGREYHKAHHTGARLPVKGVKYAKQ